MDFQGKRVTVVGAGRSGLAAVRFLDGLGAHPRLTERAGSELLGRDFQSWAVARGMEMEFNGHTQAFVQASDLLVLSPGVRRDDQVVRWAMDKGIAVIAEIELAFHFCPFPVIAVTGSNGKTTVATLIKEVLTAGGKLVRLCGNIGVPFCSVLDELKGIDYVVLEVSSFQLETIDRFRPRIAVFTNFSQNHLDRHKDLEEYFDAKCRMFMNQGLEDFAVLNGSDDRLRVLAGKLNPRVVFFNNPGEGGGRNPNHLAAEVVGAIVGIPLEVSRKVCAGFKGVEHRMEIVRHLDGADYINDSKATTAESGRWALERIEKPVVMICGGRDKNIDFSSLKELVGRKVKRMIVIGEAREKLKGVFGPVTEVEECGDFRSAVERSRLCAAPGDCVLLSPMCASFDMFKNFEERGRVFKEIVLSLA